jgi:arginyl-tRNA--protein-N-Asp/Glu arginylyltransferase
MENVLATIIIAAAFAYLGRTIARGFKKEAPSCGSCAGCPGCRTIRDEISQNQSVKPCLARNESFLVRYGGRPI